MLKSYSFQIHVDTSVFSFTVHNTHVLDMHKSHKDRRIVSPLSAHHHLFHPCHTPLCLPFTGEGPPSCRWAWGLDTLVGWLLLLLFWGASPVSIAALGTPGGTHTCTSSLPASLSTPMLLELLLVVMELLRDTLGVEPMLPVLVLEVVLAASCCLDVLTCMPPATAAGCSCSSCVPHPLGLARGETRPDQFDHIQS